MCTPREKDSAEVNIISFFALPTRCSCMFYLLNLSSYIHHHRKSIYLLTFWIASNKKIYLFFQAPEWNVVSMGLLCKNSSFMLKTKNATDGHFIGLHIPVTAMGPPHFTNISMITAHALPVVKVAEVLQIQLSGILCQINRINILLKIHNQVHLLQNWSGVCFLVFFFLSSTMDLPILSSLVQVAENSFKTRGALTHCTSSL